MFQHQVEPLFNDGGAAVPEKWMLPDNDIVLQQQLLFPLYIDIEIGIGFVEVMKRNALEVLRMRHEPAVHARSFECGMGEEDEDAGHGAI